MTVYVPCVARVNTREYSSACSSCPSNSLLAYSTSSSLSSSAFLATRHHSALFRSPVLTRANPSIKRRSVQSSWPSSAVIRLHVTVPTSPTGNRGWSRLHSGLLVCHHLLISASPPPPVFYVDLNDVHTLQTNLFGFLHHVVQGLRKKGVRHIPFPSRSLTHML